MLTTQNNLAIAYQELAGHEEPVSNLRRAIEAYEAALAYRHGRIRAAVCRDAKQSGVKPTAILPGHDGTRIESPPRD